MENTENKDYINKMYDSALETQKSQLEQGHQQAMSDLDAQKQAAQKQTDANLTRTYVEAAKAQKNYNEVRNAYGLTSGAMAQARLAQDNQLQADLTALRAQQQSVDAEAERQRNLLSQQYTAAIRKAQAENDLKKAEALYAEAKDADAQLLQKQKEAAALMAGKGDYSLYAKLYGLTPEQLQKLQGGGSGSYASGGGQNYYDQIYNNLNAAARNGAKQSEIDEYTRNAYYAGYIDKEQYDALTGLFAPRKTAP